MERGLIVSCQALPDEPLCSPLIMARMALAAKEGGAVGIRANGVEDIAAIKELVDLPLIGIVKRVYPGMKPYITPTYAEIDALMQVGVEIIALDATQSQETAFLESLQGRYPGQAFMADISTLAEGLRADELGFAYIGTTLVGYTEPSKGLDRFDVLKGLLARCKGRIIAEGNFNTPQEAGRAFKMGAYAVVVGTAITRPQRVTRWFVDALRE